MVTVISRRRRMVVHVCRSALYDIVLAAIESAVIPPTLSEDSLRRFADWESRHRIRGKLKDHLPPTLIFSRDGLETTGLLFGRLNRKRTHHRFQIDRMLPVTAQRSDSSAGHSEASAELLADWAWAMGAPWELIGGFHSHPLLNRNMAEIEARQLYGPSYEDLYCGPSFPSNNFGLIAAVARSGAHPALPRSPSTATVQFSVGSFEMWISAYSKTFDVGELAVDLPPVIRDPKDSPFRHENWFPPISADDGI